MSDPEPDRYYITSDQLMKTLQLTGTTYASDDVDAARKAASRGIDAAASRRFWLDADNTSERLYTPDSPSILPIDDIVDLVAVEIDRSGDGSFSETWTLGTDFVLQPSNAPADGKPYEWIRVRANRRQYFPCGIEDSVKVTGKFGWLAVPDEVVQATTILAGKLLRRSREAPFGIVSFGLDQVTAVRIARTDPDIALLIGDLSRRRPFA